MQASLKLGRVAGIESRVHYTWLFAFILIAPDYHRRRCLEHNQRGACAEHARLCIRAHAAGW
jgi:hypothetical protein